MTVAATLVTGFASDRSLAAAVIRRVIADGGLVVCTVAGRREAKRAETFLASFPTAQVVGPLLLDVQDETDFEQLHHVLDQSNIRLRGIVHAIGKAALRQGQDGDALPLHAASIEELNDTMTISSWSLPRLLAATKNFLTDNAGIVTLTYHGSQRAVPGYNAMGVAKAALEASVRYLALELGPQGVRVNGISAGSVRTPAAQAVPGFADRLAAAAKRSPLGRTVTAEEIAATVAFLLSSEASGITGQIITCDTGVGIVG
jgi:enoyl-[acyl-carrier protein] reductase I